MSKIPQVPRFGGSVSETPVYNNWANKAKSGKEAAAAAAAAAAVTAANLVSAAADVSPAPIPAPSSAPVHIYSRNGFQLCVHHLQSLIDQYLRDHDYESATFLCEQLIAIAIAYNSAKRERGNSSAGGFCDFNAAAAAADDDESDAVLSSTVLQLATCHLHSGAAQRCLAVLQRYQTLYYEPKRTSNNSNNNNNSNNFSGLLVKAHCLTNVYLLALAAFKLKRYHIAECTLLAVSAISPTAAQIKSGAVHYNDIDFQLPIDSSSGSKSSNHGNSNNISSPWTSSSSSWWLLLGHICAATKRTAAAINCYRRCLQHDNHRWSAYSALCALGVDCDASDNSNNVFVVDIDVQQKAAAATAAADTEDNVLNESASGGSNSSRPTTAPAAVVTQQQQQQQQCSVLPQQKRAPMIPFNVDTPMSAQQQLQSQHYHNRSNNSNNSNIAHQNYITPAHPGSNNSNSNSNHHQTINYTTPAIAADHVTPAANIRPNRGAAAAAAAATAAAAAAAVKSNQDEILRNEKKLERRSTRLISTSAHKRPKAAVTTATTAAAASSSNLSVQRSHSLVSTPTMLPGNRKGKSSNISNLHVPKQPTAAAQQQQHSTSNSTPVGRLDLRTPMSMSTTITNTVGSKQQLPPQQQQQQQQHHAHQPQQHSDTIFEDDNESISIDQSNGSISHSSSSQSLSFDAEERQQHQQHELLIHVNHELSLLLQCLANIHRLSLLYHCHPAIKLIQKHIAVAYPFHYNTAYVLSTLGKCYVDVASYQHAITAYARAHALEPERVTGMDHYSTALWHTNQHVLLSTLAHAVTAADRLSAECWIVVGNCFSLQKDHESALRFFQRASQLQPNSSYSYTLTAHEYVSNEDYEAALTSYRYALSLDSRHYNAWYGLGNIYYRQELWSLALYHFRQAIALNRNSSVLYCYLGMTHAACKQYEQALMMFAHAEQLEANNALVKYQRAVVYSQQQQWAMAVNELLLLRALAPHEASVHFMLGNMYHKQQQQQAAVMSWSIAMDLDPQDRLMISMSMDRLRGSNSSSSNANTSGNAINQSFSGGEQDEYYNDEDRVEL